MQNIKGCFLFTICVFVCSVMFTYIVITMNDIYLRDSIQYGWFNKFSLKNRNDSLTKAEVNFLIKIQHHLAVAQRYARSGITINEVGRAYLMLGEFITDRRGKIEQTEISSKLVARNRSQYDANAKFDVCPEIRLNKMLDYPFFQKGIISANCSKNPFDEVVGFVGITANCSTAKSIIQGVNSIYGKVELMLGILSDSSCNLAASHGSSFKSLVVKTGLSGSAHDWKSLIGATSTKYILVLRQTYTFNNQSDIERLIRIISASEVDAVGGAERMEDGRWLSGCYQMAMRNYTLRLIEGYDLSFNSCMYCDYLSGSFLSLRTTLLSKLRGNFMGEAVFLDYFLQLFRPDRIGALDCVDVMFSTDYHDLNHEGRSVWQQIGRKWELNRFVLPNNKDMWFSCEEVEIKCVKTGGEVVPPCCLKELSDALKFLFTVCKNNSLSCFLGGGTMAGAVKFYSTLPWERDADIDFRSTDEKKFNAQKSLFKSQGYSLKQSYYNYKKFKGDNYKCTAAGSSYCMLIIMNMKNWFIEMYGGGFVITDHRGGFRVPTRILFDGMWMDVYTNPALSLRVEYGDDILQHVEHWRTLGRKSGFSNYSVIKYGSYMKCKREFFHGCLSNFLPTGNIQHYDIWI